MGDNNASVESARPETTAFAKGATAPSATALSHAAPAPDSFHIFAASRSSGQRSSLWNAVLRYALAIGTVVVASVVRLVFEPQLGEIPGFPFFLLALVVSAGLAGFGPMLVSMIASLFVFELVILPMHPLGWAAHAVQLLMYLSTAAGILLFRYLLDVQKRTTAKEVLEREQNATRLRERDAELGAILETVPDAMIVIDQRGRISMFSTAAESLFGYTSGEALGQNVSMLMPEPIRQEYDGYIERYLRTGERRMIGLGRIVTGRRRDGSTFPIALAVGEVITESGLKFTGFVRDLTEPQRAEARMQELQSELAQMSRLTALGEMASSLAHELNQPLSASSNYLNGAARLLEVVDGPGVDTAREALRKAAEQAVRAGTIIHRMRDFVSRHETVKEVLNLGKTIEEASAIALVGAKEKGLRVNYSIDPSCTQVVADRVQVQQVLLNLLRNAVDAMDLGSRRELTVATAPAEAFVAISIADTGTGIDPEIAARLFEPFATTKPSGMGVGLSISRKIVEAHGGKIWVEPSQGGGSTFIFTLPRRARPDE